MQTHSSCSAAKFQFQSIFVFAKTHLAGWLEAIIGIMTWHEQVKETNYVPYIRFIPDAIHNQTHQSRATDTHEPYVLQKQSHQKLININFKSNARIPATYHVEVMIDYDYNSQLSSEKSLRRRRCSSISKVSKILKCDCNRIFRWTRH